MKHPKATIRPILECQQPGTGLWHFYIGGFRVEPPLTYDLARHLAACWNACRDIETADLETLSLAKILVENEKV